MQKDISLRKWINLIVVAAIAILVVNNFGFVLSILKRIWTVLFPFILGGVIAYILNIPMTKIENNIKKKWHIKDSIGRIIAIVLVLLIFVFMILFIAFLLIPELVESLSMLINNIPGFIEKLEIFIVDLLDKYPDIQIKIIEAFQNTSDINSIISSVLNYFLNSAIGFVSGLVTGFITFFTAIIFAVYMLAQKEYLIRGSKKIAYAFLKNDKALELVRVGHLANKTFHNFITGQCTEALILGVLMFIAFSICRFPYALILAVLTGITALIPIFGALIAMLIGVVLIAITSPMQAIIFVIVFQIIQQIEGNFIYPRVVGKSVGLSPMWTLLAISVGGNLFGIAGMLIGLPLASIIYALLKEFVNKNLEKKKINI